MNYLEGNTSSAFGRDRSSAHFTRISEVYLKGNHVGLLSYYANLFASVFTICTFIWPWPDGNELWDGAN